MLLPPLNPNELAGGGEAIRDARLNRLDALVPEMVSHDELRDAFKEAHEKTLLSLQGNLRDFITFFDNKFLLLSACCNAEILGNPYSPSGDPPRCTKCGQVCGSYFALREEKPKIATTSNEVSKSFLRRWAEELIKKIP